MARFRVLVGVAAAAWLGLASDSVAAQDALKLAVGAPNNWDTCIPEVGQRAGIFKKHGLVLDLLYTQGGGETMQAVISGSVDIGVAAGTAAVLGSFAKGAPVRILAAGTTGTSDLYWYVPVDSPIKTFHDVNGKTVGYSTNGASTHTTLLALIKHFAVNPKPVASGASAVTYTQAMTGQIDVGWASPPFGIEALQQGKIRLIARGSDAPSTRDQTVRVHIVNANALAQRRDAMIRFMRAYRETHEFLYTDPEGVRLYAQYGRVSERLAVKIRDEFMPKNAMLPDQVSGIDAITQDAVTFKVLPAALSPEQLAELIRIPPRER
jgi:ABC-type nitrate/sulfonate/bicarbonate transport system substrate-binding protein